MNQDPKLTDEFSNRIKSFSISELRKNILFSHPQSSVLVLGDYRGIQGVQELINRIILEQFTCSMYIFDNIKENDYAKSLLDAGYALSEISVRDVTEGNFDYDLLTNLYQKNKRVVLSIGELHSRLRTQYWRKLSLNIRAFLLENRIRVMIWVDRNLTFKEPEMFEEFRVLGLWGEEYGLRFTLFYDQYASLSSPSRTLFGVICLFPGLPDIEVNEILTNLSADIVTRNQIYQQYRNLGMRQMLVVSPSDMFSPFLIDFV